MIHPVRWVLTLALLVPLAPRSAGAQSWFDLGTWCTGWAPYGCMDSRLFLDVARREGSILVRNPLSAADFPHAEVIDYGNSYDILTTTEHTGLIGFSLALPGLGAISNFRVSTVGAADMQTIIDDAPYWPDPDAWIRQAGWEMNGGGDGISFRDAYGTSAGIYGCDAPLSGGLYFLTCGSDAWIRFAFNFTGTPQGGVVDVPEMRFAMAEYYTQAFFEGEDPTDPYYTDGYGACYRDCILVRAPTTVTPEPGALVLLGTGLAGVAAARRRRRAGGRRP